MECPKCNKQLLSVEFGDYICAECFTLYDEQMNIEPMEENKCPECDGELVTYISEVEGGTKFTTVCENKGCGDYNVVWYAG